MPFEIAYHPTCLTEDIPALNLAVRQRIKRSIEERLAIAPADYGKPLRHTAKGLWSLRIGDWRVIYQIIGTRVLILRIGHRREVYKIF